MPTGRPSAGTGELRPLAPGSPRVGFVAAGGVVLTLALFFAPALGASTFIYRDTGRLHAPMKQWITGELRRGRFPQWNPYSGLGTPVVANAIDAVQHPFNLLLVAWPGDGLKLWVLLSFAAAGAGALVWARTLALRWSACAVVGVAFALSGPLVSSSDNVTYLTSYAALPWTFAALQRWLGRGGPACLASVALAAALCAAGGDPQAWGVSVALFVPYALVFSPPGGGRRALGRALGAIAAVVVASAPFVLPVALWLPQAGRMGGVDSADLHRWNLHPLRLAELVLPQLFRGDASDPVQPLFQMYCGNDVTPLPWFLSVYVGAAVLALAGAGAVVDRRVRWLLVGAGVVGWAALGHHGGFGELAVHVPVLGAFRFWEKLAVWISLAVAAAAGFGADALLGRRLPRFMIGVAVAAVAAFIIASLAPWVAEHAPRAAVAIPPAVRQELAQDLRRGALHAGMVFALLAIVGAGAARPRFARVLPATLALVVAADLFGGNGGAYVLGPQQDRNIPPLARGIPAGARVLAPFTVREDRWPELGRLSSTWKWYRRTLGPSWNVPMRVGSPHDYVGLREARWRHLRNELPDGSSRVARLGLFGFSYLVVPGTPRMAPKAGVAADASIAGEDPELPAWIVEIAHRPRVYVAEAVRSVSAAEALEFAVQGGAPSETVIEGPMPTQAARGGGAQIIEDEPGTTVVDAVAAAPALLVLNDAWAPGWTATVDGAAGPILRTNWVARGVWIPAGHHRVRFHYRTPGLLEGWVLAIAGALGLGAWAFVRRKRGNRAYAAAASRAFSDSRTETSLETPGSSMVTP